MKKLYELLADMEILEYELLSSPLPPEDIRIISLCCDSRLATRDSIFFCLSGSITDGHKFASAAYLAGCRCFAVERAVDLPADATVIRFSDTRIALATCSASFYDHPDQHLHIVGITGTKGKTTTALLIYGLLSKCGIRTGYIGTNGVSFADKHFPTANTTPESLELFKYLDYMQREGIEVAVIEVSSQALFMHRVHGVKFDTCIYTNLYPDHIGEHEHPSFEHYRDCKRQLFTDYAPTTVIVNSDDPYAKYMTAYVDSDIIQTSASGNKSCTWYANEIKQIRSQSHLGITFTAHTGDTSIHILLNLPGSINVSNALLALSVACDVFAISPGQAAEIFENISIPGRAEVITSPKLHGVTFVIDYAHNGASLRAILSTLHSYAPTRLICLFGSVGGRTYLRRGELAAAASEFCDLCIITSDNPANEDPEAIISEIDHAFPKTFSPRICITRREDAIREAVSISRAGDIILLAGKGHENYQLIGVRHIPFSEKKILTEAINDTYILDDLTPKG